MKLSVSLIFLVVLVCIPGCSDPAPVTPEPIDSSGLFLNPPPGSSKYLLRIVEISPEPLGDTTETFTLKNFGSMPINMTEWAIRAPENRGWKLDGIVLDSGDVYLYRTNFTTLLRKDGDTLYLVDADVDTIQTVIYDSVLPGQRVRPR